MNRSGEYARLLLRKGRDDEWAMVRLLGAPGAPEWIVGFHAQQAVEKSLKAVLAARAIEYPLTHNLSILLDLIARSGVRAPPDADALPALTPFGAVFRYDRMPAPGEGVRDAGGLRDCVGRTLAWAEAIIG